MTRQVLAVWRRVGIEVDSKFAGQIADWYRSQGYDEVTYDDLETVAWGRADE
ncbi:MAG: hypothetical protein AAFQ52_02485 [Chloroflexota bacterium]